MNLRLTLAICAMAAFAMFTMNVVVVDKKPNQHIQHSSFNPKGYQHWSMKSQSPVKQHKNITQSVDQKLAAPKRDN